MVELENTNAEPSNNNEEVSNKIENFDIDDFLRGISCRESCDNYCAVSPKDRRGNRYIGKYQMGEGAFNAVGYKHLIAKHGGFTHFKKYLFNHPELQEEAAKKWFGHLLESIQEKGYDKYIGKPLTYNGIVVCPEINMETLLAVTHLGGIGNLGKLLNNESNPHDKHGTNLTEYAVFGYLIGKYDNINPSYATLVAHSMDKSKDYNYASVEPPEPIKNVQKPIILNEPEKELGYKNYPIHEINIKKGHNILNSIIESLKDIFDNDKKQSDLAPVIAEKDISNNSKKLR